MDQSFHYLMMITQTLFQKQVLITFNQCGLTAGQPKILDFLGHHDGSMQKNIADGCQIDPATLTGILNRMEEKGFIERRMEKGNRRSFHIYLTELGWQKQKETMEIFQQQEAALFTQLTPEEQQIFLQTLQKLCSYMIDTEVLQ